MENQPSIDKSTWGPGPWQDEPDRVEWEHAGLPCLAIRGPMGNWCGYAAVSPKHPLHSKGYSDDTLPDLEVHGGLTYAAKCSGSICHVPKPGEPDDVWWFGFDCGHALDHMPALEARTRDMYKRLGEAYESLALLGSSYKTLDYIQTETNKLAGQLATYKGPAD